MMHDSLRVYCGSQSIEIFGVNHMLVMKVIWIWYFGLCQILVDKLTGNIFYLATCVLICGSIN